MEITCQDLVQQFDYFGSRKSEDYQPFTDVEFCFIVNSLYRFIILSFSKVCTIYPAD